jgi:subtilisin family serine protease
MIILLSACGGGGGDSRDETPINKPDETPINSGSFIDSTVEGLRYKTNTQNGFTNSNGTFTYRNGEIIKFYIGNIPIGSVIGKSFITPIDLVDGGTILNTEVLNIARVLQTFDSDKNLSNGITLVDGAKNLSSSLGVDFSNSAFITSLLNEVNATEDESLIEISSTTAKKHLQDTLIPVTTGDDPLLSRQWYLDDLNITAVQNNYNGSSINGSIIQIVDVGIDPSHEDLLPNLDLNKSYNAQTSTVGNCTPDANESHGTLCAGIASARGYNNKGIRGVNPLGKIVGFKFNTSNASTLSYTTSDLQKAWISGDGANDITISSNSWGSCFSHSTDEEKILGWGSNNLRDQKGRIYVIAAGNDRVGDVNCSKGSANLTYVANNQYILPVASLDKNNTYSYFSNPGSNILISAYGNDIYTTTLNNKYNKFSGTSAATPMVSGGIALILEACPTLTYRDVKYILAKTAIQIDTSNSTWVENNAGLKHSVDYGYGKLNVSGAINMCKYGYTLLDTKSNTNRSIDVNQTVLNNDTNGLNTTINIDTNQTIEWVGVWFDLAFDNMGEFEYYLTSPNNTTTKLLHGDNALDTRSLAGGVYNFRLSSVAFIDENSNGNWVIKVVDTDENNQTNRTINKIKLQIVGH